jgi:hypothetical protein
MNVLARCFLHDPGTAVSEPDWLVEIDGDDFFALQTQVHVMQLLLNSCRP